MKKEFTLVIEVNKDNWVDYYIKEKNDSKLAKFISDDCLQYALNDVTMDIVELMKGEK